MTTALIYFGLSIAVLGLMAGIFRVEDARGGDRIVLGRVRTWFDTGVTWSGRCGFSCSEALRHSIARVFFHYVAHRLLKRLYALTHMLEIKTEELLRQNRRTARRIRAEKHERSHLDEIAEHKEETALSREQIEQMRSLD